MKRNARLIAPWSWSLADQFGLAWALTVLSFPCFMFISADASKGSDVPPLVIGLTLLFAAFLALALTFGTVLTRRDGVERSVPGLLRLGPWRWHLALLLGPGLALFIAGIAITPAEADQESLRQSLANSLGFPGALMFLYGLFRSMGTFALARRGSRRAESETPVPRVVKEAKPKEPHVEPPWESKSAPEERRMPQHRREGREAPRTASPKGSLARGMPAYPLWSGTRSHVSRLERAFRQLQFQPGGAYQAFEREIRWFERKLTRDASVAPHLAEAYRGRALAGTALGHDRETIASDLQQAYVRLESYASEVGLDSELFHRLGRIHANRGDYRSAIAAFTNSWELEQTRTDALLAKGKAEFAANEHRAASETLHAVLAAEPNNAEALVVRGYALIALGDHVGAQRELESFAGSSNDVGMRSAAQRGLALTAERTGRTEQAAEAYLSTGDRSRAAVMYLRLGRPEMASAVLQQVPESERTTDEFRRLAAGCAVMLGRLQEAVEQLTGLPHSADVQHVAALVGRALGNAEYQSGDVSGAISEWRTAIAAGDRSRQVTAALAAAYVQRAIGAASVEPEGAARDLDEAERLGADVSYPRALLSLLAGNAEDARSAFARLAPDPVVKYHSGIAHLRLGEAEPAEKLAQELAEHAVQT